MTSFAHANPHPPAWTVPAAASTRRRPGTVRASAVLWLLYAALGAINVLLSYVIIDVLVTQRTPGIIAAHGPTSRADIADSITSDLPIYLGWYAVLLVVAAVVFLARANWARITLTVLAVLDLVGTAFLLPDRLELLGTGGFAALLAVVVLTQVAVLVGATMLMHVGTGGFFRRGVRTPAPRPGTSAPAR